MLDTYVRGRKRVFYDVIDAMCYKFLDNSPVTKLITGLISDILIEECTKRAGGFKLVETKFKNIGEGITGAGSKIGSFAKEKMSSVSNTLRDYRNSKKVDTASIMEEIRAE